MAAGDSWAGLLWRGNEISPLGYKRVYVPVGAWQRHDWEVTAKIRFPGFDAPCSIDAIAVYFGPTGDDEIVRSGLGGDLRLGFPDTAIDLEITAEIRQAIVMAMWATV